MLSLGGGTQSTVLALLAERDYFEQKPDVAIFADTGWEPQSVYENIQWLQTVVSFPIVTVVGNPEQSLREAVLAGVNVRGRPWLSIPAFLADREGHPAGMNWRQCTTDYKIAPIRAEVRSRLGLAPRSPVPSATSVEMWLGISMDEHIRTRISPDPWIVNLYPLIDMELTREDCIEWFAKEYPHRKLPRSACVACPYRSRDAWIHLRSEDPDAFADAVRTDRALRSRGHNATRMFRKRVFLHPRRLPLDQAVATDSRERAGTNEEHWGNECAGVCGV